MNALCRLLSVGRFAISSQLTALLGQRSCDKSTGKQREGTRSMRRCVYRKQLELETLVCARGPNFPLSRLESRLSVRLVEVVG